MVSDKGYKEQLIWLIADDADQEKRHYKVSFPIVF